MLIRLKKHKKIIGNYAKSQFGETLLYIKNDEHFSTINY